MQAHLRTDIFQLLGQKMGDPIQALSAIFIKLMHMGQRNEALP